jgi:hypothetical protein
LIIEPRAVGIQRLIQSDGRVAARRLPASC